MVVTTTITSGPFPNSDKSTPGQRKKSNFTLFPITATPAAKSPKHRPCCKSLTSKSGSKSSLPRSLGLESKHDDQHPKQSSTSSIPLQFGKDEDNVRSIFVTNLLPEHTENVRPIQITRSGTNQSLVGKKTNKIRAFLRRNNCLHAQIETPSSSAQLNPSQLQRHKFAARLSRIIDVERGEVNQKRLSTYLRSVLDPEFEVPSLQDIDPLCCYHQNPDTLNSSTISQTGSSIDHVKPRDGERCKCYLGTTICQCSSSPEFKEFCKAKPDHKTQTSISSNQCKVNVPRARFQTLFLDNEIPVSMEIPNKASKLGHPYSPVSSEYSDSFNWSNRTGSSQETFPSPTSSPPPRLIPSNSSLEPQPRDEIVHYAKHSRAHSFSRPLKHELSDMPERGILTPVTECTEFTYSIASTNKGSPSSPAQPIRHHKYSYGVEVAQAFNIQIEPKPAVHGQEIGQRPDTSGKTSTITKHSQSMMLKKPNRYRHGHVHQTSNSSAGSSIGEILEADNTAIVALARSAKSITIAPKANMSASITNWPPEPKSEAWLRIQQEQDRKLMEVRERQRQLTPRRLPIPIRTPVIAIPGNQSIKPVIGKRTSSLQTRTNSSIDATIITIGRGSAIQRQAHAQGLKSGSDYWKNRSIRMITSDESPTIRGTRHIVVG